ncbi:uncharacterized protein LDX57_003202 [Aspergillus melleus]|uniref:uncharacterized protein n=1 Tax=Aspergillus melleus TaxID=138277 RepID=UPI001E8DB733|nr:uncharacterized protein LDX57_003202 [Aspergillus melleus]KAH8425449.1 hypothetical protein LDX57_003202 [Aspergillus melleus]
MLSLSKSNLLSADELFNYFVFPQILYTLSKDITPPYYSLKANFGVQTLAYVIIGFIYTRLVGKLIEASQDLRHPPELDEEETMTTHRSKHVESKWDVVIKVDVIEDEDFVVIPSNVAVLEDEIEDEGFVLVSPDVVAVDDIDMVKEPVAIPGDVVEDGGFVIVPPKEVTLVDEIEDEGFVLVSPDEEAVDENDMVEEPVAIHLTSEVWDITLALMEDLGVESAFEVIYKNGYVHQQTQADFNEVENASPSTPEVENTSSSAVEEEKISPSATEVENASPSTTEVVSEGNDSDVEWAFLNASSSTDSVAYGVTENDSGVNWVRGDDGKVKGVEYISIPSTLYSDRVQGLRTYCVPGFSPNAAQIRLLINFTIKLMDDVNRAKDINGELCGFVNELLDKDQIEEESQTDLEDSESVPPIVPPSTFHLSEAEKVFDLMEGSPDESDYEVVDPGSVTQLTNSEEGAETGDSDSAAVDATVFKPGWHIVGPERTGISTSPSEVEATDDVADADWEILSDTKMDDQEDGADEVGDTLTATAANKDDRFGFVHVQNQAAVGLLLRLDQAVDVEQEEEVQEEKEEEQENEERLKDLLRPSAFDWADENDGDDEETVVARDESGFPRGSNGSAEIQATTSSGDGGDDETARSFLEQEVHHYNWYGAPVLGKSGTPPEVSLLVQSVASKDLGRSDKYRFWSIMHRANLFIDPVIVMLEEGDKLQDNFGSVKELVSYAAGRTFKFYSPYGAWVADPQEKGSIAVDEQREDVDTNERNIVSNGRLGCKLECCPSYGLERKLRSRRQDFRVRAQNYKPSPLRQIMTVDDLSPKEAVTTNPLVVSIDEESQQGDSNAEQSVLSSPTDNHSDSDSDWEEIEVSDELRNIALGSKKPRDPVESHVATLIELPKSGSLSMGWIKDFIPWCPEPYRALDGLGHKKLGLCPNVQVTVYPVLLDAEPFPAPDAEYVGNDGDFPTSLYSREIDEVRHPDDCELSDSSDIDSLSSDTFPLNVDTYHSIVADEFNASFDGDGRMASRESLSLIPGPGPSTLQLSSSLEDPADVPLPPPPNQRRNFPKRRTRRARAYIRRPAALRHRVAPLRTTLPLRRSLSTMANTNKRCHCRKKMSLPDEPAVPEPVPSNSGSECTFPADYDSFSQLGIRPPRRRFSPLVILEKCIFIARNGARALFRRTNEERELEEENGRKARRKLTKRRK